MTKNGLTREMILKDGTKVLLDLEDYKRLSGYTWRLLKVNGKQYVVRSAGINGKDNIYLHREVMRETGRKKISHRNKNTLDNRKENLEYSKKSRDKKRF